MISILEKLKIVSFDWPYSSGFIHLKIDGLFLKKNHLLRCWDSFSCKLYWASYIVSIAKIALKKIGTLLYEFVLWSFFLLRLLFISINLSNGLAWNTVVLCGLVLVAATLVKLQKPVCRTVGFSLAFSVKPLALL